MTSFREGDFLETRSNLIFDVKGLVHPQDRVIAFLRYFPSESGERRRGDLLYKKVYSLPERFESLRQKLPSYIYFDKVYDSTMQGVPKKDITHHYLPKDKFKELLGRRQGLDDFENDSMEFCKILSKSAGVSQDSIGISGSVLVGLHNANSDMDVIVYGVRNCRRIYETLVSLFNDPGSGMRAYGKDELKKLFDFRSADTFTEWDSFLRTETRKRLQGLFRNREYFLRFVKDWNEVDTSYGDVAYKSLGRIVIKAMVVDDSEALFTPCIYKVDCVQLVNEGILDSRSIQEVSSFRGRFCEVARSHERIIARGKLERVTNKSGQTYNRVLVGGEKDDFMTLL